MELKQIKELMVAMGRTGMKRLVVKKEDFELELEREILSGVSLDACEGYEEAPAKPRHDAALARGGSEPLAKPAPAAETGTFVTSPMVGTFYTAPSPTDPIFVKIGDTIDKNSVVCIIEAMKVMNEIKAGVSGKVVAVLVETGHPVEFGTKLFRVE